MSVTARGIFASPLSTLAAMLSNSASFQKLCQAANAAAALQKIVLQAGDPLTRPYAHVMDLEPNSERIAGGSRDYYRTTHKLAIEIEMPVALTGTVTVAGDTDEFTVGGLAGLKDDHVNGLVLMMTSGMASGQSAVISDFTGASGAIVLASALTAAPGIGDGVSIAAANLADEHVWCLNTIGDILDELWALAGTGGYVGFAGVRLTASGRPQQDRQEDDYWGAVLEVDCD